MAVPDPQSVARLLEEAAAQEVVPRFRKLAADDVREKSPGEVVTAADEAMERLLEPALSALVPGSLVVGEERASADPAVLELLRGDQPVWVLDPLDGTANFAAGLPLFGTMAALVVRGETVASWIHLPVGRVTLTAERGGGAWNGDERLRVESPASPMRAAFSTRYFPSPQKERIEAAHNRFARHKSSHCAAVTYMELVTGVLDLALYHRLLPWDHAPGVLIHAEAGGYSARLNGEPYSPLVHGGGLLLAPTEEDWADVMRQIGEHA